VLAQLKCRSGRLDGVVISGGEPTVQDDLPDFLMQVKAQGFAVKLDTNGSRPCMLEALIERRLVDFISMDVKAPWAIYPDLTGTRTPVELLQKSIQIIAGSGIAHEFRTTSVPVLTVVDLRTIAATLPTPSHHRVQPYQTPSES
jgi:pyruvate formate lyase activating enzyme